MVDGGYPPSSKSSRRKRFSPFPLLRRKHSPESSVSASFNPEQLVPEDDRPVSPLTPPRRAMDPSHVDAVQAAFGAPVGGRMSAARSASPPSVFDQAEVDHPEHDTEPTTVRESGSDEPSYDLKPPPPSVSLGNLESLSLRFFSADHLDVILRDTTLSARFNRFVAQYRAQLVPTLARYVEIKKAITAIEYANAVAESILPSPGHPPYVAATLDDRFEAKSSRIVEDLVDEALTAYLTHRLVALVTDTLVKEITGNSAPIMRDLIPSLAEVYCVTDPSLPDNPIVYASEEFYNTTQYGKDYVIGRNCRFLQGPKSSNATVRRMIDALAAGQEICETILNYRRDGSPFMNLLMLAPLYDNKGQVRYFLGCQIDVSQLVEGGRGLDSFTQLIAQDRSESRHNGRREKDPKHVLGEFGAMLNEEEVNTMKSRTKSFSEERKEGTSSMQTPRTYRGRRILGMDDGASERAMWPHASLGPSGRLPGVYQNYLLVRPSPSLRITFTSPALRIPGLLQTKFLDRIGGPQHVREGILDALSHGVGVTAKITWLTHATTPERQPSLSTEGKPRWIHCTPLLGSDERVGVWMVVMVENEEVTGQLNRHQSEASAIGSPVSVGAGSQRFTGKKLYTEYQRREGVATPVNNNEGSVKAPSTARERREIDDQFRDF